MQQVVRCRFDGTTIGPCPSLCLSRVGVANWNPERPRGNRSFGRTQGKDPLEVEAEVEIVRQTRRVTEGPSADAKPAGLLAGLRQSIGMASQSTPNWNQIASFLESMQRLRDSVGFAG